MTPLELLRLDEPYLMHTDDPFPLAPASGRGATLFDGQGRSFLDFTGGSACLGHGHEPFAEALLDQALRLGQGPFYQEPVLALAKTLCRRSGMSRACFSDSGTAGNELMLRLARRYSHQRYGPGRETVLSFAGAVHGTSLATLAASGLSLPELLPSDEGFRTVEPDIAALRGLSGQERVCAVMVELISLERGVLALGKQFVHELAVLCAERDWLLLIDEVQTGIGRTGALFAFLQYGILPDAVSFGRGIAGGLPMGGMLVGSRCAAVLDGGGPGTLPMPNPICAAGALAVLDALDETTLADVAKKGDYLKSGMETLHLSCLGEIRGSGLLRAVEVFGDGADFARRLSEAGLLCREKNGVLCLLPPLLVERRELDEALAILKKTLQFDAARQSEAAAAEGELELGV